MLRSESLTRALMPDLVETLMSVTTSTESLMLFAAGAITMACLMLPIVLRGAGGQRGGSSYTPKPVKLSGELGLTTALAGAFVCGSFFVVIA